MVYKKRKKQVYDLMGTTMLATGGSLALGAIGGTSAGHGQAGLARATSFMPTIGTVVGVGMLFDATKSLEPRRKKNRKKARMWY